MSNHLIDEDCCFYFNSKCTKSDCRYRHSTSALNSTSICKYWTQKRCLRGEDCPFRHTSVEQIKKSPQIAMNEGNKMMISYIPKITGLIGSTSVVPQLAYNYMNKFVSGVPNHNVIYGPQSNIVTNKPIVDNMFKPANVHTNCCESCVDLCRSVSQLSGSIEKEEYEKLYVLGVDIEQTPIARGQRSVIHKGYLLVDRQLDKWLDIAIKRSYLTRHALAECDAICVLGRDNPHKNIIQFFGSNVIDNRVYINIERSHLGDLREYMASEYAQRPPTEEEIFHLFRHIRDGVEHMHECGFAHRDINRSNIVVFQKIYPYNDPIGGHKVICKLCDFGSARRYLTDGGNEITESLGAPICLAPEVCDMPSNAFAGDVYSLGVLLYQMSHNGKHPFYLPATDENLESPYRKIWKEYAVMKRKMDSVQWSPAISKELLDLLKDMLEPDPSKRITLKDIYMSEWMQVWMIRCCKLYSNQ